MKFTLVLLALITSSMAFAGNATVQGEVGPAGCGLGNMAFGARNAQVFAATTNGTFDSQTFGITTGTSNCGPGGFQSRMDIFVDANKVALANDSARGQGETITALANMLGCGDATAIGSTLKANYGSIFSAHQGDARAISHEIQTTLNKSNACTAGRNS